MTTAAAPQPSARQPSPALRSDPFSGASASPRSGASGPGSSPCSLKSPTSRRRTPWPIPTCRHPTNPTVSATTCSMPSAARRPAGRAGVQDAAIDDKQVRIEPDGTEAEFDQRPRHPGRPGRRLQRSPPRRRRRRPPRSARRSGPTPLSRTAPGSIGSTAAR
ncbi:MAG: hypothetical protein MZW92_74020 [Comamonadaceae bacterium]|nr:hypothetical protein [Comamonadaceae bacterium]